jgi:tape measure domain-containing protein
MAEIGRRGIIAEIEMIFKDKGISEAESKLNAFQNKVGSTTDGVNSKLQGLGEKLSKYYSVVVVAAVAGAIAKLADLAKAEDLAKTKFESLIGSGRKANELVDALDSLAIAANQSGEELQQAAFSLLKFGTAAKDIPNQLKTLSSVSAATGVSVGALAEQFGRINFKGFAIGRELKVIEKEGIPIFQALSKETGKSVQELRKLAKVSSEDVNKALNGLVASGGAFAGILDKQINSLDALQKRTASAFDDIKETVGNAFLPGVKAVYQSLIPALIKVKDFLQPLVDFFAPAFQTLVQFGITAIGTAFDIISAPIKGVASLINDITKSLFNFDFTKLNVVEQTDNIFTNGLTKIEQIKVAFAAANGIIVAFGENLSNLFERIYLKIYEVVLKGSNLVANTLGGSNFLSGQLKDVQTRLNQIPVRDLREAGEFASLDARNKILKENLRAKQQVVDEADEAEAQKRAEAAKKAKIERDKLNADILKEVENLQKRKREIELEGLFDPKKLLSNDEVIQIQDKLLGEIRQIEQSLNGLGSRAKDLGVKLPFNLEFEATTIQEALQSGVEAASQVPFEVVDPLIVQLNKGIQIVGLDGKPIKDISGLVPELVNTENPNKKGKQTFLSRLFGDDKDVQQQGEAALKAAGQNVKDALNLFFDAEIAKTDFLIEQQKKRIDEVNKIAALGNAEQLQIEEERLRKLEERRERSAKRQNAINAVQIVGQTALAISSFATAITSQAAKEHPLIAIAEGVALLAAIAAGVAQVRQLSQGFYEGTEYVDAKGHHRSGIDTVPSMLTRGERVMTVQQNEALGGLSNPEVVQLVQMAKRQSLSGSSIYLDSNKVFANDFHSKKTIDLLEENNRLAKENTEAMKNTFIDIRFDGKDWRINQRKAAQQAKKHLKIFGS